MLFNSFQYWIFFFIVAALFYSVPFRFGKILLLLASYVFYMWWDPRFIVLILTSTVVDYYLGIFLETATGRRKKLLLVVSLVVNLGILGFFKYYDFFAGSLAALLRIPQSSVVLQIVLPVGVSFYTFASLSYTFDVYWGKMKAVRNPIDYALFIAFFPHLIAGPIIRARQFISQIWSWRPPAAIVVQSGIILVLSGLIKKMVFADRFAVVSDWYFNDPAAHPGWLAAWSGCLAITFQVFFDFSGYTDIARGCAKLLGFEFPLNFARPFLSRNPPDFWQRWHITLSTWVRDYLFMPLSRGRKGRLVLYRNMLVIMVLVGLWHGANWTFIAWGAYHGLLLVGYRLFDRATVGTPIYRCYEATLVCAVQCWTDVCLLCVKCAFLSCEDSPGQRVCLKCAIRFPACNWRVPADGWHNRAAFSFPFFWPSRRNAASLLIVWLCSRREFKFLHTF